MTCDGRRVEGVVKEREEAFRDLRRRGRRGPRRGAARAGAPQRVHRAGRQPPAGRGDVIEIEYVQRVHADEGALRWMIPTLVAPRYIPGSAAGDRTGHGAPSPTDRVPDADRITPRDRRRGLRPRARPARSTSGATSSREPVARDHRRTQEGGTHARDASRSGEVALDRDVVVARARRSTDGPRDRGARRRTEGGRRRGTFALTVVPDLGDGDARGARAGRGVRGRHLGLDGRRVAARGAGGAAALPAPPARGRPLQRHRVRRSAFAAFAAASRCPFTQRTLEQADRWVDALRRRRRHRAARSRCWRRCAHGARRRDRAAHRRTGRQRGRDPGRRCWRARKTARGSTRSASAPT